MNMPYSTTTAAVTDKSVNSKGQHAGKAHNVHGTVVAWNGRILGTVVRGKRVIGMLGTV